MGCRQYSRQRAKARKRQTAREKEAARRKRQAANALVLAKLHRGQLKRKTQGKLPISTAGAALWKRDSYGSRSSYGYNPRGR